MRTRLPALCLLLYLGGGIGAASAHDDQPLFNTVNVQVQAERDVPNDRMTVVLVAERDGSDAARVAGLINQDMQWAMEIMKQYSFAHPQTRNYQTWPVYEKDRTITGWHALQELEIKGTDMEGMSDLAGKLQEKLKIRQMSFSPADATRRAVENELIAEAMHMFRERLEVIRNNMDDKYYRIINLTINTGGYQPPVVYAQSMAEARAAMPSPAVEAGTSALTVTVSGSVQFTAEKAE